MKLNNIFFKFFYIILLVFLVQIHILLINPDPVTWENNVKQLIYDQDVNTR